MRRLSVTTTAGLVLATAAACSGDSGDSARGVAERTSCGAHGGWTDGAFETERYGRDERGRLLDAETRDARGALVRRRTWTWEGKQLRSAEVVEGARRARTDYDYEFDRLLRVNHVADDGTGYVTTYGYAGDAMVTQDVEWRDRAQEHRHATITGDLSERTTIVDCAVTGAARCQTWIFEQPDRIGEHWLRASLDRTSDGTIDRRFERTLDARGLELTFVELAIDARGETVIARETTTRDPGGVQLGYVRELVDGAPRRFRRDDDFTCNAEPPGDPRGSEVAAVAPPAETTAPAGLDDASLITRRLRRDLVGPARAPRLDPRADCAISALLRLQ